MRKLRLVCLAVFILAAAAAVVSAAAWQVGAAGATEAEGAAAGAAAAEVTNADYVVEYEMSLNNVVVSTERSMIVNDDQRLIISSEINMTAPQPLKMRNMLIINNFTKRPEAYYMEAEVRGAAQKLDATFTANQCQYRAEHALGVQNGTINLPENYLVWENNVWIQLMYLVSGFNWAQEGAAGGAAGATTGASGAAAGATTGATAATTPLVAGAIKAQVLIPTTMSLLSVTIEDRGIEKITIEGVGAANANGAAGNAANSAANSATLQARRIALNFGGTLIMDAWLELDTRIPLKISISAQKLLVVRKSLTLIDPTDPAAEEDANEDAEEDVKENAQEDSADADSSDKENDAGQASDFETERGGA